MNRTTPFMLGLIVTWCSAASAEEQSPVRSISVSGTVVTKTAPDQIMWRIGLTDIDVDMRVAKARSDDRIKSIVALQKTLSIGKGDLDTGPINIRREYERNPHGVRGDFKHFVVSRSMNIRQRDLARFDEFLDTLVSSTEMEVSFSFATSRIHQVRAETRLKALKAAKDKATAMAEVVEARLGKVLTINEHAQGGGYRSVVSNNMEAVRSTPTVDLASDKFVPAAINVRMTVYATFELE